MGRRRVKHLSGVPLGSFAIRVHTNKRFHAHSALLASVHALHAAYAHLAVVLGANKIRNDITCPFATLGTAALQNNVNSTVSSCDPNCKKKIYEIYLNIQHFVVCYGLVKTKP